MPARLQNEATWRGEAWGRRKELAVQTALGAPAPAVPAPATAGQTPNHNQPGLVPISCLSETMRGNSIRAVLLWGLWAFLVAQTVKNLPAVWKTQVQSLGWADLLEKGMATHSSILAWRIPWTEKPGGLQLLF